MNPRAAAVTGISDRKLENEAAFPHVWRRLMAHLGLGSLGLGFQASELRLVGHNSKNFDDLMLCAELRRFQRALERAPSSSEDETNQRQHPEHAVLVPGFANNVARVMCADTFCAAKAARKRDAQQAQRCFPKDNKLASLYSAATGRDLEGAHDALVDTAAVAALLAWAPIAGAIEFEPWEVRVAAHDARVEKRRAKEGAAATRTKNMNTDDNKRHHATATSASNGAANKRTATGAAVKQQAARPPSPPAKRMRPGLLCEGCGATYSRYFLNHACARRGV